MGLLSSLFPRASAITAAIVTAAALLASPSFAQSEADRRLARELGDQGKAALARNDFAAAAELFRKASAMVSAPTLDIGLARAEVGLGHLVAARRLYAHVIQSPLEPNAPPAFAKAVKEATAELAELEPRIPWLLITVNGPAATTVTIDGAALSPKELGQKQLIDPGRHVARAEAPLFQPAEASFTAFEGKPSEVRLDLVPSDGGAQGRATVGFGLLGLGAGALAAGGVLGAFALRDRAALIASCPSDACDEKFRGKVESFQRESLIAWPALGVGVAGLAVGTALILSGSRGGAVLPRKLGPALVGTGIAGLSVGAVTGVLAFKKDSSPCVPMACEDRTHGARELGAVAIVSLAAGTVSTVSGALLIALKKDTTPPPPSSASITPEVGPGTLGLSGRF